MIISYTLQGTDIRSEWRKKGVKPLLIIDKKNDHERIRVTKFKTIIVTICVQMMMVIIYSQKEENEKKEQ